MATRDVGKKRRRNRKARTEGMHALVASTLVCVLIAAVSSSESSSSDESPRREESDNDAPDEPVIEDTASAAAAEHNDTPEALPAKQQAIDPEQAFEDFYLKQATKEFASDLDKLRSAPDFKEGSVPVLIEALRQGRACYGVEERRRVGEGGGAER